MASFVNSFALLEGESQQSYTSANKKKKSKKSKKAAPPALPPSGTEEAVHAPAVQPAHASESDTVDDDGFQPAGKHSRKGSMTSFNPAIPASAKQLGVAEGITDLENAASQTTFRTSADRVKQWRHWQQQARFDSKGKNLLLLGVQAVISAAFCRLKIKTATPSLMAIAAAPLEM